MKYDVAVLGLGAMGSAAAFALATRGLRVVAYDRLAPPHTLGSSHGHTRIIREAYYEHPLYVPLVRRAYELWQDLERTSGRQLFRQTGGVWVGPPDGALVRGAIDSARMHGIAHEVLDATELSRRFPAYRARPHWVAVHEQRAGMLSPEDCIAAHIELAQRAGATIHLNEPVEEWRVGANGVSVKTARRNDEAAHLVVAAGAWLPQLERLLDVTLPLEIERQMSHWFDPADAGDHRFDPERCPVGLWETDGGELFLTMPDEGHGVKCGMHHSGSSTSPETVNRVVSDEENAAAGQLLGEVMPGAAGRLRDARVCLYTNTPDAHFIIDRLSGGRVVLLSPCSGHGFKFASAIGEVAADLVVDGRSRFDLTPFSLARFR
jgi:sarcosine oxidase